ncbi:HNH endonuclease signature motif containing protein [Corynebacterium pseudodiphtheriticum]|uniref:HNH endonuclease signature motif containing protein n=1 Tax=Corynebacterium pseudodiphtheriticum TaxID=37637 RepID=UPI003D71B316
MRCKWCGKEIPRNKRGRPPKYCSRAHKQRAYESRKYQIFEIWEELSGKYSSCYLCGKPLDYSSPHTVCLDHMISTVHGGRTDVENLRPVHLKCNARKGSRLISESFLAKQR